MAPAAAGKTPGKTMPQVERASTRKGTDFVRGFSLLRVPLAAGSPLSRGLLVKRHEERAPEEKEAAARTLFVTHLDNFITEAQLSKSFSTFGVVEKVMLKSVEKRAPKLEQRADGVALHVNFAHVVFTDPTSVDEALKAATGRLAAGIVLPPSSVSSERQGKRAKAGTSPYRVPMELKAEIDEWMAKYDESEEKKKQLARESLVDEDGFTKVISGITRTPDGMTMRSAKRPGPKLGTFAESMRGEVDTEALQGELRKGKKKKKEMPDFYRFQLREQRRAEIVDHRKRKVEDLETVERMKKKKKFQ